jgi:hypothetical protein
MFPRRPEMRIRVEESLNSFRFRSQLESTELDVEEVSGVFDPRLKHRFTIHGLSCTVHENSAHFASPILPPTSSQRRKLRRSYNWKEKVSHVATSFALWRPQALNFNQRGSLTLDARKFDGELVKDDAVNIQGLSDALKRESQAMFLR